MGELGLKTTILGPDFLKAEVLALVLFFRIEIFAVHKKPQQLL